MATGKRRPAAILPAQYTGYKDELLPDLILYHVSIGKHTLYFSINPSALFYQLPLNQLLKSPFWNLRFHINDNSIAVLHGIDAAGTTAIINSRKELGQTVNKPIREERVT